MSHDQQIMDRNICDPLPTPKQIPQSGKLGSSGIHMGGGVIERTKFLDKWNRCGQYDGFLWDAVAHGSVTSSSPREPHPELHPTGLSLIDAPGLSQPCWGVTRLSVSHTQAALWPLTFPQRLETPHALG